MDEASRGEIAVMRVDEEARGKKPPGGAISEGGPPVPRNRAFVGAPDGGPARGPPAGMFPPSFPLAPSASSKPTIPAGRSDGGWTPRSGGPRPSSTTGRAEIR